ncbi:C6 zinc finger domain-containing protein [Zalerion maritima]|uniref:C6 zinc finger domain-containing protein n=1 Tax=Zalerion maritima TaxID=339359 RepID=A0AAD5WNW0_9PEZI|nr:C6 zinc finger domain-containing protein [Zalerion maritima]
MSESETGEQRGLKRPATEEPSTTTAAANPATASGGGAASGVSGVSGAAHHRDNGENNNISPNRHDTNGNNLDNYANGHTRQESRDDHHAETPYSAGAATAHNSVPSEVAGTDDGQDAGDGSAYNAPGTGGQNGSGAESQNPPRKRQRVRLSCLECRRRKLSCDRAFPCERCVKSGTPDQCSYESKPGPPGTVKAGIPQATFTHAYDSRRSMSVHSPSGLGSGLDGLPKGADIGLMRTSGPEDRIRRLEVELAQVKSMLGKIATSDSSTTIQSPDDPTVKPDIKDPAKDQPLPREVVLNLLEPGRDKMQELRFFRGKEFRTRYFGPHNACMAFSEVRVPLSFTYSYGVQGKALTLFQLTGLGPYMKETAEEWLRPIRSYSQVKDRKKRLEDREKRFWSPDPELDNLLPSQEETDIFINAYLDKFEQVHRIVHIPTFRRQYSQFWNGGESRYGAFTALVLSMMAVALCLHTDPPRKVLGPKSVCHQQAETWIWKCEEWLSKQSQKHRRLIHYQIACLIYLGKRVNTLKKKRFWTASGSLINEGIAVGLHRDPSHMSDRITPFNQEMRRRIWATIQEFNMQASFDHGLPTLMSQLHYDVTPPRNLDDNDFAEDTVNLPASKPTKEYTFSSYQHLSRQSLPLRLQLSLTLTGPPGDLDYDQVIRYTNDITQEIDSLPSWDVSLTDEPNARKPLLAYTLLHIQLRQYLIPLHQPYLRLRQRNSKYQYSEIIYYNAARDMVLLHDKLAEQGIRTLYFLREDAVTTAINLCSVTLLQPRGSTNMIMINSEHTLRLLEKCLAMKEDRLLRCGNNEPWGYSIMCAAYGLLEAHLGLKTTQEAKAASAQRFVDLHYKMVGGAPAVGVNGAPLAMGGQPPQVGATPAGCDANSEAGMTLNGNGAAPAMPMNMMGQMMPPGVNSINADGTPAAPLPWLFAGGDPSNAGAVNTMGMMPEFNLEVLGLNLNDLWGDDWNYP